MDLVQILTLLGVSGIIVAIVTARLSKSNEFAFKTREQKLARYKVILLFMDVHLTPDNIKYLNTTTAVLHHTSKRDVIESLKAEYRELFLYASKDVILTVKRFIDEPSEANFIEATLAMRQDLNMGGKRIKSDEISL